MLKKVDPVLRGKCISGRVVPVLALRWKGVYQLPVNLLYICLLDSIIKLVVDYIEIE